MINKGLIEMVTAQAEDEGLWCEPTNVFEAYLQQELRKLHGLIEKETVNIEHSVYCLYNHFLAYTNQPHTKEIRQAYYHGAGFNENADTLEPQCHAGCRVDSHDESWYESLDP